MDQPRPQNGAAGSQPPADFRLLRLGTTVALGAIALYWLFTYFGIDRLVGLAIVGVGLGFVIFFHELGHFLVAKWCDVHVEVFSIGFGPAIPGCSFRRGETLYKIAWVPLGGYVKMVGEGAESEEGDDDPRSFKNKSVWQRMAIISAGVTMNIILGIVCFILVYMLHGVDRQPGVAGTVDAGSPAWRKGVPSGAVILQIGNVQRPYFDDLMPAVMFSSKGQKLTLVYQLPDQPGKIEQTTIEPRREDKDSRPVIGIAPPSGLKLMPKRMRGSIPPVLQTSAAAQASPPFELGDKVIATTDPGNGGQVTSIEHDRLQFERRLVLLEGKAMIMRVRRHDAQGGEKLVDIEVPPAYQYAFGMRMRMGQITAVRDQSPAAAAGVIARDVSQGITEGDIIDQVEVTETDGSKTRYVSSRNKPVPPDVKTVKDLDPLRLPYELQQWALRKEGPKKVTLVVPRTEKHAERGQDVTLELTWDDRWRFDQEVPFSAQAPTPIPGLGLAYQIQTTIEAVNEQMPDGQTSPAWSAGLKHGDVVKAIRFEEPGKVPGQSQPGKWQPLDSDQWAETMYHLQSVVSFKKVNLRIERDGQLQELEVTAVPDTTWANSDRGVVFQAELILQKADNIGQAVVLGLERTYSFVVQMYQSLRAIATSRVSPAKSVGGPIMIFAAAYGAVMDGIWTFVFFLGVISVNLAVINFLPIPILDGGHMVFLIYEKIRGIPASESIRSGATIVGLAVILLLVVFTFWIDIARFF
ncbi:MAG TPA: site-2 protease family protein [Gemmataceae bacterium]|nr:site-2 protease family protein [Gemmataceae bacterium]